MIECNMQIVYCTTPANYYHVLRRQILRDYRKPLILFTSKSLLRHPNARSSLSDMGPGTSFMPVISDESCVEPDKVERIILCTGQVYYALLKARNRNEKMIPHGSIAIVRVEQLSPFPAHHIVRECERYPNASQIVWCQEEPLNMGMWFYVEPRLETAFKSPSAVTQSRETLSDGSLTKSNAKSNPFPVKAHAGKRAIYAGRPPNAGVATGLKSRHVQEEHNLLASALLKEPSMARISQVDTGVPVWETL